MHRPATLLLLATLCLPAAALAQTGPGATVTPQIQPTIEVSDANHLNRGELILAHRYEGVPLKMDQAQETLENVHHLWKRPVHLETFLDDQPVVLTFDDSGHRQEAA